MNQKSKIVMLGAGNLAVQLSKALQNAGFEITQVYNRSELAARELASLLQAEYITDSDRIVTPHSPEFYTTKGNLMSKDN